MRGPDFTLSTTHDDRPSRWCFECRRRTVHTWAYIDDAPERQPSYYEPVPVISCERCHGDHTLGFGLAWDGPNYPSLEVWNRLIEGAQATRATPEYKARLEEGWRTFAAEAALFCESLTGGVGS